MAFLDRVPDSGHMRNQRFSLLLLDHDDVYFEDHSADMMFTEGKEQKRIEGRLKVCANCVVFDPKEYIYPIYKFPHASIVRYNVSFAVKGEKGFQFCIKSYSEMKEGNLVKPWVTRRSEDPDWFGFIIKFSNVDDVVQQLLELNEAWLDKVYGERRKVLASLTNRRHAAIKFNIGWIEDLSEQIVQEVKASRVLPLTHNPGRVMLTSAIVYFQPFNNIDSEPVFRFKLCKAKNVVKRRYLLRDVGLEIFFTDNTALYLAFEDTTERDMFESYLRKQEVVNLDTADQKNMMVAWQQGAISNFDYLMYLNNLADRSFTDLAQYPVFPWIIKDYTSDCIDLNDPTIYRDLSKPMGAQNPERLKDFIKRYEEMPEPKFFYGTHYSTPGYVLFYTIRVAPEYSLNLQNGKFDRADRLFQSIEKTWCNAYTGVADVKELVPEFFMTSTSFLQNNHNLDLGITQNGERVENVLLPPWASTPEEFLKRNRGALESDYVSQRLHQWIDLIFGAKQTGHEAVKAHNLFYYLTYESAINLDDVSDAAERHAYETQIMEFGQTPRQLFHIAHPPRRGPVILREPVSNGEASNGEVVDEITQKVKPHDGIAEGSQNGGEESIKELSQAADSLSLQPSSWSGFSNLELVLTLPLHKDIITCLTMSPDGNTLFSVSQDSTLTVYNLSNYQHMLSQKIGTGALSSIAVLPDEDSLLLSSWDNNLYIFSLELGSISSEWNAHHDAIAMVKVSSFGNEMIAISGAWDGVIKMWELKPCGMGWSHSCVAEMFEHTEEITALTVHENSNKAISGDSCGRMMLWDLSTQGLIKKVTDSHSEPINDLCFTPDGLIFITACADLTMKLINTESLVELVVFHSHEEITQVRTDGTYILTGNASGSLTLWDAANEKEVQSYHQHKDPISALCISRNGDKVVSGDEGHSIVYWSTSQ
eukprot:m.56608 g.56608  ORF g.56608 m.56608 type:complete len:931 (-) comp7806_c0_seq1:882-3674(-)